MLDFNNKLQRLREKKLLYNNNFWDFREELQNWKCRLETKSIDLIFFYIVFYHYLI